MLRIIESVVTAMAQLQRGANSHSTFRNNHSLVFLKDNRVLNYHPNAKVYNCRLLLCKYRDFLLSLKLTIYGNVY